MLRAQGKVVEVEEKPYVLDNGVNGKTRTARLLVAGRAIQEVRLPADVLVRADDTADWAVEAFLSYGKLRVNYKSDWNTFAGPAQGATATAKV